MADASKAVAWRWRTPHGWVVGKLKSSAHAEPLYSQATVDELRAEVAELKRERDTIMSAFNNAQIKQFIEKHGEPVPIVARAERAEAKVARMERDAMDSAMDYQNLRERLDRAEAALADLRARVEGWKIERLDSQTVRVTRDGDVSAIASETAAYRGEAREYALYGLACDVLGVRLVAEGCE